MRISFYGNPNNFFDNAFFDYGSDDFNVDLISSSSTRLVVENPSTGARTVFNGSGIVASDNDSKISGTLTSIDFQNSSGDLVASFTEIDWTLREFIGAVDEDIAGGDGDPLQDLLTRDGGITIDVSEMSVDPEDVYEISLLESLGAPVTYVGLDEGGDTGGDDTPVEPEAQAIFPDGFDASTAPDEAASVYRLYEATLDRAPDAGGLADWTERLLTGESTLQDVSAGFTGSTEFLNSYGELNNSAFVELLYNNVLDRSSDVQGLNNWVGKLEDGMSRAEVVIGFSESAEFVQSTRAEASTFIAASSQAGWSDDVYRLYQATLDRAPDAAGFENWTEQLAEGRSFASAIEGFTESREFQNTYGTLDNEGFVELLYQNVLDRAADADGLADWTGRLDAGTSRAEVVEGFAQSAEFTAATADDLQSWMREQMQDDVVTAPEGESLLAGGAGTDAFVFNADTSGSHRVLDLEAWDYVAFENFNYDTSDDALSHMVQSGSDVLFSDEGVQIAFEDTQLSTLNDNMVFIL